uniref:ATP synthase complex subunit 8 n=1 Tax=Taeniopteryx ugola TaxID=2171493 RepID=A0A343X9X4_9NEOP|nr:ATP synthase F0 subunit 8 [Taeniopteryx ugola]YP_010836005.1 ATP synthase F0 subunit 8 [Taeniopteryx auberti]AWH98598.1 ATP synthase F0 subunit 8 [Taeniopteryx ugola]UPX88424.1 ATP synthase F0 subunit 8 [Taeniopteryx nebulosa]WGC89524.1 ATP synthase F0 subunit 8 [Taeniopteryx auberti]
MPQMAPISWLTLFIAFSAILVIFSAMNYFSFLPKSPEISEKKISQTSFNWKW